MIVAAADGSSLSNPGPAGWAWYVDADRWAAGGWPRGTNNMAELMAVLDLLRQTAVAADEELLVLCDSQYVINSVTRWMPGWKRKGWRKADGKPVMNVDLLMQLDQVLVGRTVKFEWVKGHAGHDLNEAADLRARAAATAYQQGTPVDQGPGFVPGRPAVAASGTQTAPASAPPAPRDEPDLFSVPEPGHADVGEVVLLEKSLLTDRVRSDRAALAGLLHPDFVEVGASGRIWTRGRLLAEIAPLETVPEFELLGTDVLADDLVLVRWRERAGRQVRLRSSVWQRATGQWRLRFHQGTPVD